MVAVGRDEARVPWHVRAMRAFPSSCALGGVVWAMAVLGVGCGDRGRDDASRSQEGSAPQAQASGAAGTTEGTPGEPDESGPSAPRPDDEACVQQLAAELPQALGDLLDDLGYRDALADACAAQRAVSDGDEATCDGLTATALRAGCRRRLAVRHGRPDACPRVLDRGRDPVCLAWATRAPARCAAAVGTQALVCRAPFEANAALCRELGVEQAPCEAAVVRVGPLLEPREPRALPHVSGELVARFVAEETRPAGGPPASLPQPVALELGHGVYVSREGCTATLQLAPAHRTLAHREHVQLAPFLVPLGELREVVEERTVPAGELVVGLLPVVGAPAVASREGEAGRSAREAAAPPLAGHVQVLRLQPRRGGEAALTVDVQVPAVGGAYHLTGELRTYVRDLDPPGECQAPAGLL